MTDLNNNPNGNNWGNPLSRGILADNSETRGMTREQLVAWLADRGVVLRTNSVGNG